MRLTPITQKSKIAEAYQVYEHTMMNSGTLVETVVGHKGVSWDVQVAWDSNTGIWSYFNPDATDNRYWCAFGTENPNRINSLDITVEINMPFKGYNARIASCFATDNSGDIWLVHSGKVGGGRKGIGKAAFWDFYGDGLVVALSQPSGKSTIVIPISKLGDPSFARKLARFVHQVQEFKEQAAAGLIEPVQLRKYWAFFCNPRIYDVEASLESYEEQFWTSKRSQVKAGDRAILWRGLGEDGHRGIVGLAEVIRDPELLPLTGPSEEFAKGDTHLEKPQPRVRIRQFKPLRAPLWLGDEGSKVLEELTVANSHGGTVFRVKPEQWNEIVALLGGWQDAETEEEALERLANAQTDIKSGQGFKANKHLRKAIEKHSMAKAKTYFEKRGFEVDSEVHKTKPYDLLCTKGTEALFVEVKGTSTEGSSILLTRNEVAHNKENRGRVALYLLHSIGVSGKADRLRVSGGQEEVLWPWDLEESQLTAIGYKYQL